VKVLVTGDRNWTDELMMEKAIGSLSAGDCVIQGLARGADAMARYHAIKRGLQFLDFPANWDLYGRGAGPIRNKQMLDQNPDVVWAFHENLAQSRGTLNMVRQAMKKGTLVKFFFTPRVLNIRQLNSEWMTLSCYAYIGRRGHGQQGTWGNPVAVGQQCPNCGNVHRDGGATLPCYREMLQRNIDHNVEFLEPLRGKHLVCFCAPQPCHGDVILRTLGA
jgi:hypothetical protein